MGQCVTRVAASDGWGLRHQCSRQNGHGPDGAYCKQHDPNKIAAKRQLRDLKWDIESQINKIESERTSILRTIADGHSNPHGLAKDYFARLEAARKALAEFKS